MINNLYQHVEYYNDSVETYMDRYIWFNNGNLLNKIDNQIMCKENFSFTRSGTHILKYFKTIETALKQTL